MNWLERNDDRLLTIMIILLIILIAISLSEVYERTLWDSPCKLDQFQWDACQTPTYCCGHLEGDKQQNCFSRHIGSTGYAGMVHGEYNDVWGELDSCYWTGGECKGGDKQHWLCDVTELPEGFRKVVFVHKDVVFE